MTTTMPIQDAMPARDAIQQVTGRTPTRRLLWMWVKHGVEMPDGSRLKLPCWRIGKRGRWQTTPEAVREYLHSLMVTSVATDPTPAGEAVPA